MQLTVDGTDPDLVREVLEVEIESMEARHRVGQKLFKDAGGYAPTIGVLGTVMGLLHVMQLLQTPELLGPAIAGAFMATLYGVGSANVIFMPTAGRLATLTQSEVLNRTLVIEGILAIQAGENPRVVSERLLGFLPPADREAAAAPGAPTLQAVPEAQAGEAPGRAPRRAPSECRLHECAGSPSTRSRHTGQSPPAEVPTRRRRR
jgi:chemotaxis protein MotA